MEVIPFNQSCVVLQRCDPIQSSHAGLKGKVFMRGTCFIKTMKKGWSIYNYSCQLCLGAKWQKDRHIYTQMENETELLGQLTELKETKTMIQALDMVTNF
jgi:hypothetical protein